MIWIQQALVGLASGSIFALAGMGLVLTYKATGIFNFAHGAIAIFVAYVFFQLRAEWGWPLVIAGPVAILVVGPLVGVLLERLVFRPLNRRGASTTEKLVATVGVFILMLGVVIAVWTPLTRRPPALITRDSFQLLGDLRLGYDQLANIVSVTVVSIAVWLLFRRTHLGTEIRAVVDRPLLAEQASVNANRVAAISWAMGTGLAGLAGVLIAAEQGALEPFFLTLFVLETFAIAVIARLTSVPLAVASGVLLLGVGQALLTRVNLFGGEGFWGGAFGELKPNVSVILLFVALLVYRRLDVVGEEVVTPRSGAVLRRARPVTPAVIAVVGAAILLLLPQFLSSINVITANRMVAMAIIFLSIVAVTGFSGHITLGQAALAGFGAFVAARVANSWDLPVVLATVVGGVAAIGLGFVAGWPALRRRGLFLALTTLALGMLVSKFVFLSPVFAGGVNGLQVVRPSLFGWSLDGDYAFYYYELVWLALMLLLARNLRSGRLGRALAAMRDSEPGSRAVGIDLRAYKLFIFGASAFIAGIGGALLTQQAEQFQFNAFNPLLGLIWFAVVVVAGVGSILGAVLGAFIFVMLDIVFEVNGLSQLAIGLAALSLGRLPGGSLLGLGRRAIDRLGLVLRARLAETLAEGRRARPALAASDAAPAPVDLDAVFDRSLRRTLAAAVRRQRQPPPPPPRYLPSRLARERMGERIPSGDGHRRPAPPAPTVARRFAPSPLARSLLRGGG